MTKEYRILVGYIDRSDSITSKINQYLIKFDLGCEIYQEIILKITTSTEVDSTYLNNMKKVLSEEMSWDISKFELTEQLFYETVKF